MIFKELVTLFLLAVSANVGCGQSADQCGSGGSQGKERIWTIGTGHDWGGHEYFDESGYLAGFIYDLIPEVCKTAGIICRTVWDKYTNCWDSEAGQHSTGGEGLLGGRYDACSGWSGTVGRMQVFDFSLPFFPATKSYFYQKKGSNFKTDDVSGKTIGFQDGFMSDEKCLARQSVKGVPIPKENIRHYEDSKQMIDDLADGKIDAIFVIDNHLTDDNRIEKISSASYSCSSSGDAVMTRKDNDFIGHWNRGFQQLQASGRYSKLCEESRKKHAAVGEIQPCL